MAAFSYQPHHPFLLDSMIFLPNMAPTKVSASQIYQPHPVPPLDPKFHESSCLEFDRSSKVALSDNEPSVAKKQTTDDDSTVVDKLENGEQVTQDVTLTDRKRRIRNGINLNSAKAMDHAKEGKNYKKQKKCNDALKNEKKESSSKEDKKDQKKSAEEPPKGYIHVRARRGQATDSHSLAERVRREKISERMKILQCLVPGCDKVTGKALMLDEIINYVQSLQNQVEFLSMKLASVNPMFYDFGVDLEALMVKPELPSLQHCNPTQPTAYADTTTTAATATTYAPAHNCPLLDVPAAFFLQPGQRPNVFSHLQDNGSLLWDMEDQRQRIFNSSELNDNNLGSFHNILMLIAALQTTDCNPPVSCF